MQMKILSAYDFQSNQKSKPNFLVKLVDYLNHYNPEVNNRCSRIFDSIT